MPRKELSTPNARIDPIVRSGTYCATKRPCQRLLGILLEAASNVVLEKLKTIDRSGQGVKIVC